MPTTIANADEIDTAEVHELIERARIGCRQAFAELVTRHGNSVRLYLSRYVDSASDADDLAQEVFLAMYRDLDSYDGNAPFAAWLLGIARNRALHFLRSELRRRRREGNAVRIELAKAQHGLAEADYPDAAERELRALRDCLDGLPPNSRRLVERFYFSAQTAEEIAAEHDTRAGTVRMTLLRIRRGLAECIERKTNLAEDQT